MSLSRVKTWVAGEVLTAADLENEFNNIINNGFSLVQPWVGTFDLNGNTLILDGDADTSIDAATDDTIDFNISGADDFRMTANTFTALSGSSITIESGTLAVTAGNVTMGDGDLTVNNPGAHTNTVATPVTIGAVTSGTPAAGIGTGIVFQSESQDENPSNFGQLEFAATDIGTGTEDTYFQVLTRVAGAALTATYRWIATGAFKAIFTHANSADRTYTLPNFDGTLATLAGTETLTGKTMTSSANTFTIDSGNGVKTGGLATATGSATADNATNTSYALNDYSFFPATWDTLSVAHDIYTYPATDPSNTTARFSVVAAGGGGVNMGIRWRYITSSDDPTIWIAYNLVTGVIKATWTSDDPTPGDIPGVEVAGCISKKFKASALESFSVLSTKASEADALIRDKKLRPQHQAYRALQLLAKDDAPSQWIYQNCLYRAGKLETK